ncbi:MAG: hypothetical protein FWB86_04200 [Treponema sp.]|nr:hypothetical protein [Treponema sp.]MCL2250326.1 hypothetical protein [Treponema sp.]
MINLKNKIITIKGQELAILAGKPSKNPVRDIFLLNTLEKNKADYSLWYVQYEDIDDEENSNISIWPYDGDEDRKELIKELLEKFLETAFDDD